MELSKKSISTAFVIILAITILVSILGMVLMSHQPLVLQGQIETTESVSVVNYRDEWIHFLSVKETG